MPSASSAAARRHEAPAGAFRSRTWAIFIGPESTGRGRWSVALSFATVPTPLIASDDHLAHDGLVELVAGREVPCYESPERATAIREALLATGDYALEAPSDHGPDPIAAVHSVELIDLVEHVWTDAIAAGRDPARPLLPDTFLLGAYAGRDVARAPAGRRDATGSARSASTRRRRSWPAPRPPRTRRSTSRSPPSTACSPGRRLAYGLCRPPGHHAGRILIGGYCFFNNAAIAAEAVVARGAERVAILDVDFHHGNGTQQIFWERATSSTSASTATRPASTRTSAATRSSGAPMPGEGATLNLPLPPGTDGDAYLATLDEALDAIRTFDADAPLIVSLGFDTYHADPICNLALQTDDYARIGSAIAVAGDAGRRAPGGWLRDRRARRQRGRVPWRRSRAMTMRTGPIGRSLAIVTLVLVASSCGLFQQLAPPGAARWALLPDAQIGPETAEFTALVTEVACASGQSSEGRIVGPDISYTGESVTITFAVRGIGEANCPSNPPTPVVVTLEEPLGDRVLLDGGTDPAREPPVCANLESCE